MRIRCARALVDHADSNVNTPAVNLFGLPKKALESLFVDMGEKPFRARQMMQWIYGRSVFDLNEMTNISVALRRELAGRVELAF